MRKPSINTELTLTIQDGDHIAGPDTAVVTVVAYCDFECPYCGRAYPLIKRLQARLGDRLRFVFRHFPLTHKHPLAQQAAEATEAADAQGQFWAMHDLVFENQDALGKDDLCRYAEALHLDLTRFERELRDRLYAKRVERDVASGRRIGVKGTDDCRTGHEPELGVGCHQRAVPAWVTDSPRSLCLGTICRGSISTGGCDHRSHWGFAQARSLDITTMEVKP